MACLRTERAEHRWPRSCSRNHHPRTRSLFWRLTLTALITIITTAAGQRAHAAAVPSPGGERATGIPSSPTLLAAADLAVSVPDSVISHGDTLASSRAQSPRGALLRSALVPGWGQWRNGQHLKAVLFAGTVAGLSSWALSAQDDLRRRDDELRALRLQDPRNYRIPQLAQRRQDQAARRNTRILYVLLGATAAALDAYVDAHLATMAADRAFSLSVSLEPRGGRIQTRW